MGARGKSLHEMHCLEHIMHGGHMVFVQPQSELQAVHGLRLLCICACFCAAASARHSIFC